MSGNVQLFSLGAMASRANGELMNVVAGLSIPVMLIGFTVLMVLIFKLVKMLGDAQVARFPIGGSNRIEIPSAGKYNICLEVPMMTALAGSGLSYKLTEQATGEEIPTAATAASLMGRNSGAAMTLIVREFSILQPGTYALEVSGFKPQKDYSRYQVIIARPTALKSLFYILGIALSGILFILGFVFIGINHGAGR